MESGKTKYFCIYHPQNQGVAFCKRCNGYICIDCMIIVEGKRYCKKCYQDAQRAKAAPKTCISHPDKLGIVLCKRCGGYICSDCIIGIEGKKYCKKCYNDYQHKVQSPINPKEPEIQNRLETQYSLSNHKNLERNINSKTTWLRMSVIVIASFILLAGILSMYLWRYHEQRYLRAAEELENIQDYHGAIQQTKLHIINHPNDFKANIKLLRYYSQIEEFYSGLNILKRVDSLAGSKNKSSRYEVLSAASFMLQKQLTSVANLKMETSEKKNFSKYVSEISSTLPRIYYLDSLLIKYKEITSDTSTKKDALCITKVDTIMSYLKNELVMAEASDLWYQAVTLFNRGSYGSAAFKFEEVADYLISFC